MAFDQAAYESSQVDWNELVTLSRRAARYTTHAPLDDRQISSAVGGAYFVLDKRFYDEEHTWPEGWEFVKDSTYCLLTVGGSLIRCVVSCRGGKFYSEPVVSVTARAMTDDDVCVLDWSNEIRHFRGEKDVSTNTGQGSELIHQERGGGLTQALEKLLNDPAPETAAVPGVGSAPRAGQPNSSTPASARPSGSGFLGALPWITAFAGFVLTLTAFLGKGDGTASDWGFWVFPVPILTGLSYALGAMVRRAIRWMTT